MNPPNPTYEYLHHRHRWAYGEQPDRQLAEALAGRAGGRAVDLGGGQGRHALYLASLGFDTELVDLSDEALAQAGREAVALGLNLQATRANLAFYEPPRGLDVVVGALIFHVPARHAALKAAGRLGDCMNDGALFYLSLPGFDDTTRAFALQLMQEAGCRNVSVEKHVVTRLERPRLPVERRNETRGIGYCN